MILILVFLRLTRKEDTEIGRLPPVPTLVIKPTRTATITPASGFESPNQIIWKLDEEIDIPKEINDLVVRKTVVDDEFINNFAKIFDFEDEGVELPESGMVIFNDNKNFTSFYVDKENLKAEFSKNLLLSPLPTSIVSKKDTDEISQSLVDLLIKAFGLNEDLGLTVTEINYESVAGPRFVEADEENASIVEFKLAYTLNGYPILSNSGAPISAKYSRNGELVKLTIKLSPEIDSLVELVSLKEVEKIKMSNENEFVVLDVEGTREFDLSSEEEVINNAVISGGYFGYLYVTEINQLIPYVFLEGKSELSTGLINVLLGVNALEEK